MSQSPQEESAPIEQDGPEMKVGDLSEKSTPVELENQLPIESDMPLITTLQSSISL